MQQTGIPDICLVGLGLCVLPLLQYCGLQACAILWLLRSRHPPEAGTPDLRSEHMQPWNLGSWIQSWPALPARLPSTSLEPWILMSLSSVRSVSLTPHPGHRPSLARINLVPPQALLEPSDGPHGPVIREPSLTFSLRIPTPQRAWSWKEIREISSWEGEVLDRRFPKSRMSPRQELFGYPEA